MLKNKMKKWTRSFIKSINRAKIVRKPPEEEQFVSAVELATQSLVSKMTNWQRSKYSKAISKKSLSPKAVLMVAETILNTKRPA